MFQVSRQVIAETDSTDYLSVLTATPLSAMDMDKDRDRDKKQLLTEEQHHTANKNIIFKVLSLSLSLTLTCFDIDGKGEQSEGQVRQREVMGSCCESNLCSIACLFVFMCLPKLMFFCGVRQSLRRSKGSKMEWRVP